MTILHPDNHDSDANEFRLIKRNHILFQQVTSLRKERDTYKKAYERYANLWCFKLMKKLKKILK